MEGRVKLRVWRLESGEAVLENVEGNGSDG